MSKSFLMLMSLLLIAGCQGVQNGTDLISGIGYSSTPQTYSMEQMIPAALGGGAPYSYQFSDLDCTTGKHEFATEQEFCGALSDDRLNEYCADNARREYYLAQCGPPQSN